MPNKLQTTVPKHAKGQYKNINKTSLENEWRAVIEAGIMINVGGGMQEMERQMYSPAQNKNQYDTERAGHKSAHRHGNS